MHALRQRGPAGPARETRSNLRQLRYTCRARFTTDEIGVRHIIEGSGDAFGWQFVVVKSVCGHWSTRYKEKSCKHRVSGVQRRKSSSRDRSAQYPTVAHWP